ncbi:MAG TPA: ferredoxin [Pseudonocardiaceae bacterium]
MRVTANPETCAVASLCVYRAPGVFDQDEDGHVKVLQPNPPAELHEDVRWAARSCPTRSIRVLDDPAGPAASTGPGMSTGGAEH